MIGIHGSTDEQAAIRRAVRAPFQDLRRRDARALCEDFTPVVAADLTAAGGSCAASVGRLFRRSESSGEYVPSHGPLSRGRVSVTRIHWRGDRATADSLGPGAPAVVRHWQLALVHGRWRIDTPARLRLRSACEHRPPNAGGCLSELSVRLGSTR